MPLFNYKKWFFDVYTSRDEYFILFISRITVLGIHKIYLQAHGAEKADDGNYIRKLIFETKLDFLDECNNSIITRQGTINFNVHQISLNLNCGTFSVNLTYHIPDQKYCQLNPFIIKGRFCSGLSWKPLVLCGNVNGEVNLGSNNIFSFRDDKGYIDQVLSSFLPFSLPVKELYWGRVQSDDLNLTFTIINGTSETQNKAKVYCILHGKLTEFNTVNLAIHEKKTSNKISLCFPEKYTLIAKNNDSRLIMEIENHREAVANDFIGDTTSYGKRVITILKLLSGSPIGVKSVAKANIGIFNSMDMKSYHNLTLIDEYVCFDYT